MTRKEASQILDDYDINFEGHTAEVIAEAFDVAFEALEQEPKTGHWVRDEDWNYHCNVCGAKAPWSWTDGDGFDRMVTPYCPQCGAKMKKWEDADEEWYVHRDEVYGKGK